jgi:2-polyprenyl-3-methyl-5-hydroxy-6-metoxy-1,4-benzoquinol methylase
VSIADLRQGRAEEISAARDSHDIVFSMAVLEHIHEDSSVVFEEMRRIARKLVVTIEDEHERGWRHFPRDYSKCSRA